MTSGSRFTVLSAAAESLLGRLADEFLAARERGQPQNIDELAAQFPELADVIRQAFPAMLLLRQPHGLPSSPAELLHGEELGDFRLIRELGRGGMGVVYEAMQRSLGRRVALKVLPLAGMLDERRLRRFQNEAHAAAALQHPHIVPVYGVGCERGVHYYAMQLIHGVSLAEVLQQLWKSPNASGVEEKRSSRVAAASGDYSTPPLLHSSSSAPTQPVPALSTLKTERPAEYFRTIARLGVQAAEALAYAHREGVIHRDIKPSNLLLDENGKLWIADFGLARMHTDGELTLSGDLLGTLRYMSPEQLTDNKVVDQRTDVYSLGLTLYEMLAGAAAFADIPRQQLAQKILSDDPPSLRTADASIPVDLETIILRATAKDRDARYQSADALAADLQRFVDCKPILARRPNRVQRVRYWARRNPSLATTLALLLLTMTVLSVGGPLMAWRQTVLAGEYRRQLDIADLNVAYQAWSTGNVNQVENLLSRHEPADDSPDQRSFTWRYLRAQFERSQRNVIARHQGRINCVAVAPDGRTVASAGSSRRIVITNLERGEEVRSWHAHDKGVLALAYDPNGSWLASGSGDHAVKIWSLAGEPTCLVNLACDDSVRSLAVTPDGEYLVAGTESGALYTWSAAGTPRWTTPANNNRVLCIAFAPDGQSLATAREDGRLQIRRTATGELVRTIDDLPDTAYCVAYSPTGDKLLAGAHDGMRVWDVENGMRLARFDAFDEAVRSIAVGRTGLIATGTHQRMVTFWDEQTGRQLADFVGNREGVKSVAFLPNGEKLVSGGDDGTLRLYDASDLQRRRDRWHDRKNFSCGTSLALSANGQALVSTTLRGRPFDANAPNGEMIFWDVTTRMPRVTRSITVRDAYCVAVSSDGHRVATCGLGGVRLWDTATGEPLAMLHEAPPHCLLSVAFSPDGRWLAAGGRDAHVDKGANGLLMLWEVANDPPRLVELPIDKPDWRVQVVCFAHDSRHLVVAGDRQWYDSSVDLWALGANDWRLERENIVRIDSRVSAITSFTSRNQFVVTTWDGETVVQDLVADTPKLHFRGHRKGVYSSALTADGSLLATGGYPDLRLWDAETGDQLGTLMMPMGVSSLEFTPDGNTLIWAGEEGTVNFERAR